METRVYEMTGADQVKVKGIIEANPYAPISFARQGYKLKEGKGVGGDAGKYYLFIKGEPDFFKWADEQVKVAAIESFKRSEKPIEAKVIASIEEEENAAEQGMGAIFG